jgi:bifunctional DNase/RNase
MKTVQLSIIGLTYSQTQNNAYALLLGEDKGSIKLPIVIGAFEAQSIAIALEKDIQPPRPLTHDLFTSFALTFNIYLKKVMIHKLEEGIFYSYLVCELDGKIHNIDSRTSDAVALALRFNCPIFTYEKILEKAGIILDNEKPKVTKKIESKAKPVKKEPAKSSESDLKRLSEKALTKKLNLALEKEDYELAAIIRDEINRRNPHK